MPYLYPSSIHEMIEMGLLGIAMSRYSGCWVGMAEQGFAEAQVTPWFGFVVPAGTPQPVVERISAALETALASAEVRRKLDVAGCDARSAPLKRFADVIAADVALWARVVKEAGIQPD